MKILVTSDLHQWIPKWKDLVKIVGKEKPRFILIAGDLLPKTGGYAAQKKFFSDLKTYCQEMKRSTSATVLTYFGNDDFHILEPLLDELEAGGLCLNLNGRVHREDGLVFCGMNKVRDYPFGYKYWCVPDEKFLACPQQFCGEGLTLDDRGEFILLKNLAEHLAAKPSIKQELERLKNL
jgi:Icc-related predicted phosphoesterase